MANGTVQVGEVVEVLPHATIADAYPGIWTVLGFSGRDVLLARGDARGMDLGAESYDLAITARRLIPAARFGLTTVVGLFS